MKKLLLFCLLIMLVVAGCRKKISVGNTEKIQEYREIIAKFADLPDAPFQASIDRIAILPENHDQLQIFYRVTMPVDEIVLFYQQQMERLGWQLYAQSTIEDVVLHYTKPEQICSLIIRKNQLSIYIMHKQLD